MRIWYVTMRFPVPREVCAHNEVAALQRVGHEVEVHGILRPHPMHHELVDSWGITARIEHVTWGSFLIGAIRALVWPSALGAGLRCAFSGGRNPTHTVKALLVLPRAINVLWAYRRRRPDIVHLFWGHYPSVVGFLIKSLFPGAVVTMGLGSYDLTTGFSGSARMAEMADVVFTLAEANVPALLALGVDRRKIVVARHGIAPANFDLPVPRKRRRRIVSVGVIDKTKGMDRVLGVFKVLQARFPDASLVILGDGEERSNLESLVRRQDLKNVELPGWVPHEAVMAHLLDAEVFLFLSDLDSERIPNVAKEAVAARCLCVVSDTPGIEEVIPPGAGFVVPAHDLGAACEAVTKALCLPETEAAAIRETAWTHLRRHFHPEVTRRPYLEAWSERLRRRSRES